MFSSETKLVSAVISSTLGCGDESCELVTNTTKPILIQLHHHHIQVNFPICIEYDEIILSTLQKLLTKPYT